MFGFDWTEDESVDLFDDLLSLSVMEAMDRSASDGRRDDEECSEQQVSKEE